MIVKLNTKKTYSCKHTARDVTDLHQLLELLNVVEKYQVLPIKQAVIEKMKKMDVDKMELEHILSALGMYLCRLYYEDIVCD